MPIKACTVLREILNRDPLQITHFVQICRKTEFQVLPSKFIPLGESTAFAELQNQNNVTKHRTASPLGVSIQLEELL